MRYVITRSDSKLQGIMWSGIDNEETIGTVGLSGEIIIGTVGSDGEIIKDEEHLKN